MQQKMKWLFGFLLGLMLMLGISTTAFAMQIFVRTLTGKTITLKAQPNKGFGFAGWFVGDSPAPTSLDYRMSPNTIEVFGDTAVVARFVSVAEDTLEFDLSLALESFVPGEAVEVPPGP